MKYVMADESLHYSNSAVFKEERVVNTGKQFLSQKNNHK